MTLRACPGTAENTEGWEHRSYKKANLLALDYGTAAPIGFNKTGCTNDAGIRLYRDCSLPPFP